MVDILSIIKKPVSEIASLYASLPPKEWRFKAFLKGVLISKGYFDNQGELL